MSDTDDGFDEAAVRAELREKYADEDRGETERMSELLLQGATMTNQHCDRCGTPIFRYEGRSFCPNCQQAADQQQAANGQQTAAQQPPAGSNANGQQQAGGRPDSQQFPAGGDVAESAADEPTDTRGDDGIGQPVDAAPQQPERADTPSQQQPVTGLPASEQAAPPSEAADALESSIAALARRAAGSDDPRTAREYLEAAREAAEALAALRHNA